MGVLILIKYFVTRVIYIHSLRLGLHYCIPVKLVNEFNIKRIIWIFLAFECIWTPRGTEYLGTSLSITRNSATCQAWNVDTPHARSPPVNDLIPDDTSAHNYCRLPSKTDQLPWCYTTDPNVRWDFCKVVNCTGYP